MGRHNWSSPLKMITQLIEIYEFGSELEKLVRLSRNLANEGGQLIFSGHFWFAKTSFRSMTRGHSDPQNP